MTQKAIHIHEAYNSSFKDHKVIHEKESFSNIEKMLHMSRECILVKDFNLHHLTWKESFYSRQQINNETHLYAMLIMNLLFSYSKV